MSLEAMKMALETLERLDRWLALRYGNELTPPEREVVKALRQAIEQAQKQETLILDRGCYERGCVAYDERDGDGVNISQERVDETAKCKHEWVGLTDEQINEIVEYHGIDGLYETSRTDFYHAIEAKLKEKNT